MRVLVTGAGGQLGGELCRRWGATAIGVDSDSLDFEARHTIRPTLAELRPDAIVNCAAYTQVDRAEEERQRCWRINAEAVEEIAVYCESQDIPLIQISTDYVFGNQPIGRPWREEDLPEPHGVYAESKLGGESAALQCRRALVVRTCGLYARRSVSGARHFVHAIIRSLDQGRPLRVVCDQRCSPTYVPHLAEAIEFLLFGLLGKRVAPGIYHVVNPGDLSWHEFACAIVRHRGDKVAVEPIASSEWSAAAPRPRYSVLDTTKYHLLGGPAMPSWHAALAEFFSE